MKSLLNLWVNGRPREDAVAENALLVDYLRDMLGLTGTKQGCDGGECARWSARILRSPFAHAELTRAADADRAEFDVGRNAAAFVRSPPSLVPGQRAAQRDELARGVGIVTRHRAGEAAEVLARQHIEHRAHRGRFERRLEADEEVLLMCDRHEVETEAVGRGTQAEAAVRDPGGDIRGDRQMRRLGAVVAGELAHRHAGPREQFVGDQSRARTRRAIREPDPRLAEILKRREPEWIARRDDQALFAAREANQLVHAQAQFPPETEMDPRAAPAQLRIVDRQVDAGERARADVEPLQRLRTASRPTAAARRTPTGAPADPGRR